MFFSGYRPLFVVDHFRKNEKKLKEAMEAEVNQEFLPWDVSVSGLPINPEMKNVPRSIVRNLVPYKDTPTEEEAQKIDHARALTKNNVKVVSIEFDTKTGTAKFNSLSDESEFSYVVNKVFKKNADLLKTVGRLFNPESISDIETPLLIESPASESYGRIVYLTSVKRKRKLKMNKHKLRKRRKLQRALKRKLKR